MVKDLELSDLESLKELYEEAFNIECNLDEMKKSFRKDNKNKNSKSLVIKDKNIIIGHIKGDIIYNIFGNAKPYMYISEICVHHDYRHKGYGKELLKNIEEFAKENDCSYTFLNCSTFREIAQRMYKDHGYFKRDSDIFKKEL